MNTNGEGEFRDGADERTWETTGDDEMFLVQVIELALEEHHVRFGSLELVSGADVEQFRHHLLHALSQVARVHDIRWDREVAWVKGAHDGAALLRAAVAVLEQHRAWLDRRD